MKIRILLALLLALSLCAPAHPQQTPEWRSWNQPVQPFEIAGNIYYVGANEITSFLITSPQGHLLLDGGFAETAPQIEQNIEKLGFHLKDVKIIVNSQAHSDYAGGFAELKRATGARLLIAPGDFDLVARGGHDDFAFGNSMLYPAVKPDGTFKDGDVIRVGDVALTAHITPGHTRGCTTWTTRVMDEGKNYDVTFLCSVSSPDYKLVDNPKYPNIISDYRETFRRLNAMHTDIFLGAHGSMFHLEEKRKAMSPDKPNPFVVPGEFQKYIESSERDFEKKVAQQQAEAKSATKKK